MCSRASRFSSHVYTEVLEQPAKRWMLVRKEKRYCRMFEVLGSRPLVLSFTLLYALFGGLPFLLSIMFGWGPILTLSLVFSAVCVPPILLLLLVIQRVSSARRLLRNRAPVGMEEFNSIPNIQKPHALTVVSAVRDTLGFIHKIDPSVIYPSDTLQFLCYVGGFPTPCQFEVVLGIAQRLGLLLSEYEVDRIGDRIFHNAKTVWDLAEIVNNQIDI